MIKFSIPFSTGKYDEPDYLDPDPDHPILNIGAYHRSLKNEVTEWLDATLGKRWTYEWDNYGAEFRMIFELEEDLTLFLLRWA